MLKYLTSMLRYLYLISNLRDMRYGVYNLLSGYHAFRLINGDITSNVEMMCSSQSLADKHGNAEGQMRHEGKVNVKAFTLLL